MPSRQFFHISHDKTLYYGALLVLIIIATAVRLVFLFQPIRYDEAFTFIMYASKPIQFGLSSYYLPNNHLFHTLLVRTVYILFGNEPWIIRLPAFIAGILTVPAAYIAVRELYNKEAAVLTAGLTASSSILIEYSTLARGYTFICLFFLILIILGTDIIKNDKRLTWYLFSAVSTLGFFTIPIMLYPFGIVVNWLFLYVFYKNKTNGQGVSLKNLLFCIVITGLLTLLLYIPVLTVSGFKALFANRFVISRTLPYVLSHFPHSIFSTWTGWHRDMPAVFKYLLIVVFFLAIVLNARISRYRLPIILPVLIFIVVMIIIQRVVPYNRVWLFLLPLYFGIACSGISFLILPVVSKNENYKRFFFPALAVVASVYLSLGVIQAKSVYTSNELGTLRDAKLISVFLKDYLKPGDKVIVACPSDFPMIYYFNKLNIPVDYLVTNIAYAEKYLKNTDRILIIVNNHEQTIDDILKKIKYDNAEYKVLKQFKEAGLFKIEKRNPVANETIYSNPVH